MSSLTIGKLAKQTGVTIETIRHYQRIGLLPEPDKPDSGYRCYSDDAVIQIRFIKRAQQAGFTLKEIATLLALDGAGRIVLTFDNSPSRNASRSINRLRI